MEYIKLGRTGLDASRLCLGCMSYRARIGAPIVGATKAHHLDDAVAALTVKLTQDEIEVLEEPYIPHAVAGFA